MPASSDSISNRVSRQLSATSPSGRPQRCGSSALTGTVYDGSKEVTCKRSPSRPASSAIISSSR
jgi:hypothetical protein